MGRADHPRLAPDPCRVHLTPRSPNIPTTRKPNPRKWNRRQPDTTVGPAANPRWQHPYTATDLGTAKPSSEKARKIQAKQFLVEFFYQYDYVHRHSGVGWHTPSSVHFGTSDAIDEARQQTLNAAYHANPARFGRRPQPPAMPTQAWINQPEAQPKMN